MLERLNALLNAAQTICSSLDIEEILESLALEIRNIMEQTDAILIFSYDEETDKLVPCHTYGLSSQEAGQIRISPGETIAGTVFETRKSILLPTRQAVRQAMRTMSSHNLKAYQGSLGAPIYPESAICVPLLYRNDCLGVITIDRFIPDTPYTVADAQVFESIANLASTAIANSRMYQQAHENWKILSDLNEQLRIAHEQLGHSIAINKALAVTSLRGQGLKTICCKLSEMLHSHTVILSDSLELLACNDAFMEQAQAFSASLAGQLTPLPPDASAGPYTCSVCDLVSYVVPISDGTIFSGYAVFADYPEENFSLIESVSSMACLLLAIELMSREREHQLKEEFIGESLNALLKGNLDTRLLRRLQTISPCIGQGKSLLVLMDTTLSSRMELPDSQDLLSFRRLQKKLLHQISFHVPRPIYTKKDTSIIVLYTFPSHWKDEKIYNHIQELYTDLQKGLTALPAPLRISCGRVVDSFTDLPQSLTDARLGIQYLQTLTSSPPIVFYPQLGIRKLLFRHDNHDLEHFYLDVLGPVILYDREHNTELLPTIQAFKQCHHSLLQTASALNIHKNTLTYRIRKVRDLLKLEHEFGRQWSDVELALDIRDYLDETGIWDN